MNLVRVYNLSAEKAGEGFPLLLDYDGTSYVFQPSDGKWEQKKIQETWADPVNDVSTTRTILKWVKVSDEDGNNYADVPASFASDLMHPGSFPKTKGILKSGVEMEDIVSDRLRKAEAKLTEVNNKIDMAEKRSAAKKRKPSKSAIAEA